MELIGKLKIDLNQLLYLLDAPQDLVPHFSNCDVLKEVINAHEINQVVCFVKSKSILEKQILLLSNTLNDGCMFWVAYPKKSGKINSDLSREAVWKIFENTNWEPVTSVSIDDNWTALRFRHQSQIKILKRATPISDRVIEGIDFKNRKVELPLDAIYAMNSHSGLIDFFMSLSFTHQKEYVESIVMAKKLETRQRRIVSMTEMLLKLKEQDKTKRNEL